MEAFLNVIFTTAAIILGLLLLIFLVVVHELGHAIAARRNGVEVEEFGIGFPPKAYERPIKKRVLPGTLFTLNWLPLGGFVKLKGEHDEDSGKGTYGHVSFWAKTKILLAGVGMNWVIAALIFTVLALVGMPKVLPDQFSVPADTVEQRGPVVAALVGENSPASRAGLENGDRIIRLAGQDIDTDAELRQLTRENAGERVSLVFERDGVKRTTVAVLNESDANNSGFLGVTSQQTSTIRATWSAPIVGVGTTVQFTAVTLAGIGQLLANTFQGIVANFSGDPATRQAGQQALANAGNSVAGPIGILGIIFPSAVEAGIVPLLYLTAVISLTLAVMNTLPIPGLDGGRWFLMALYRVMRRPLTKEKEEKIVATGMIALFGLIILITILDIGKFF